MFSLLLLDLSSFVLRSKRLQVLGQMNRPLSLFMFAEMGLSS